MNETDTRAELIDPLLAAAGWGVVESHLIRREFPITLGSLEGRGRSCKPLTGDYVLYTATSSWPWWRPNPTPFPWA